MTDNIHPSAPPLYVIPKLDQALLDVLSLINQARQDVADLMGVDFGAPTPTPGTSTPARESFTDPLQVTGGWKIEDGTTPYDNARLSGFYYAAGPGDLRIRTNDRALLDRILVLLDVYDRRQPARPMALDPDLVERVAAKAGVDLGGNPLPKPAYLIWSNEHRLWWRPESAGYTRKLAEAGRYTKAEALEICRQGRDGWQDPPDEVPVREEDAIFCST